jgi:hypothetical protein
LAADTRLTGIVRSGLIRLSSVGPQLLKLAMPSAGPVRGPTEIRGVLRSRTGFPRFRVAGPRFPAAKRSSPCGSIRTRPRPGWPRCLFWGGTSPGRRGAGGASPGCRDCWKSGFKSTTGQPIPGGRRSRRSEADPGTRFQHARGHPVRDRGRWVRGCRSRARLLGAVAVGVPLAVGDAAGALVRPQEVHPRTLRSSGVHDGTAVAVVAGGQVWRGLGERVGIDPGVVMPTTWPSPWDAVKIGNCWPPLTPDGRPRWCRCRGPCGLDVHPEDLGIGPGPRGPRSRRRSRAGGCAKNGLAAAPRSGRARV